MVFNGCRGTGRPARVHPAGTNAFGNNCRFCGQTPIVSTRESSWRKKRKYSKSSGSDVNSGIHRYKKDTAKSGKGGKGGKVKSKKQAIARAH
jgi:hypothetical protein